MSSAIGSIAKGLNVLFSFLLFRILKAYSYLYMGSNQSGISKLAVVFLRALCFGEDLEELGFWGVCDMFTRLACLYEVTVKLQF